MAKSGIYIKPSKRGTFTSAAKKRGKSVQGFASTVLANKENYSPAMVKKANFARNAAKWKKEFGGYLDQQLNEIPIQDTPIESEPVPQTAFGCGGRLARHAEGGPLDALKYLDNPQPQGLFGQVAKGIGASVGGLAGGIGGLMQQGPADIPIEQTQAGQEIQALGQQQLQAANVPPEIKPLPVPQGGKYQDGGILPSNVGYGVPMEFSQTQQEGYLPAYSDGGELLGYLPEYSFGSWLGDNAGGILQGAGDAVSAIPGIGMIAGPILNMAGKVTDALVGKKRAAEAAKAKKIKDRIDATKAGFTQQLGATDQPQYEAVAEFGGNLVNQREDFPASNENPVIVGYNGNSNTHQQGVGGVPVDAKGNASIVSKQSEVGFTEAGEVTWNGYVFSNKLKVK